MSWHREEDDAAENLKVRDAGTAATVLWWASRQWCSRHLTDGFIPKKRLRDLWRPSEEDFDHKTAASKLVEVGLWHDRGDAWEVHDYLEYNFSKEETLEQRAQGNDRVRRHRERKKLEAAEAAASGISEPERNGVTSSVTNGERNALVTLPHNTTQHNEEFVFVIDHAREQKIAEPGIPDMPPPTEPTSEVLSFGELNDLVAKNYGVAGIPPKWIPLAEQLAKPRGVPRHVAEYAKSEVTRDCEANKSRPNAGLFLRKLEAHLKAPPEQPREPKLARAGPSRPGPPKREINRDLTPEERERARIEAKTGLANVRAELEKRGVAAQIGKAM